jgi:hypothetical protein
MNHKFLILILSLIAVNVISQTNQALDKCSLIDTAKGLISNPCFVKVQNIIACMSPCEQQIWVDAFKKNTDTTKCFDCSFDKTLIKNCNIQYANDLVSKFGSYVLDERKALGCLSDFEKSNPEFYNTSDFYEFVQIEIGTSTCYINFITDVVNMNIKKRRYLCMSNADRDNAALTVDANGRITQFKFSPYETNVIVGSFNRYADCKAKLAATIRDTINRVTSTFQQSSKCATRLRLLDNSPTTTSTPLTTTASAITTQQSTSQKLSSLDNEAIQMFNKLLADVTSNTALVNDINTAITSIKNCGVILDSSYPNGVLSNIQLTDDKQKKAIQTLLSFGRATNTCDVNTNYIITLSNKTVKCEGTSCPADFTGFSFQWITQPDYDTYSIYAGCSNTTKFFFSTFSWFKGHFITQLRYNKGTTRYDLTQRYQQRLKQCIPGATRIPNSADGPCPIDQLKKECTNALDLSCKASGLSNLISTIIADNNETKPQQCVDVSPNIQALADINGYNQENSPTTPDTRLTIFSTYPDDNTLTCLKYVNDNLLSGLATNVSTIASINSNTLSASVISSTYTLRYLTTAASMVDSSNIQASVSFDSATIKRSDIAAILDITTLGREFGLNMSASHYSIGLVLMILAFLF